MFSGSWRIFWHPWDLWGRIHIDLNKNSVWTGCVCVYCQMVPWVLSAIIFEFFQILIRSVHHNFPRIRAHFRVWVPINYYNLSVDGNHNLCFARPGQKCYLKYCSYSTIYWSMSIPVSNFISLIDKGQLISKCPFGVFKSPKKPTNFFPGFLSYPLKKRSNQKSSVRESK